MSTVVFVNAPAYGHINPTLPLVVELIRHGERVFYYTTETFQPVIEQTGATFCSYGKDFPNHFAQGIEDNPFLENPFVMIDANIETGKWVLDHLLDEIRELQPDYLIHDSFCFWGRCLAQTLDLPAITSIGSLALNRKITAGGPDQLFVLLSMLWKGWTNFHHSRKLMAEMVETYHIRPPKFLFEVIRNYSALNVIYTSKAFQPYAETFDDQQYKFIGPLFPPTSDTSDTSDFPIQELEKQPVIYISMGTIYNKDTSFFRTCIEAFAQSKWQIVMTLGGKGSMESLGTLPANFIVRNYVPQDKVLQHSVLFITNGGMNSVNHALYHNVPMILIPQSADHPWNAKRVAELGAGKVLSKKQITASRLRATAEEILSQPDYAQAAATIGETLRTAGGSQKAVEAISAFKLKNSIA